jgi:hypothetical protein
MQDEFKIIYGQALLINFNMTFFNGEVLRTFKRSAILPYCMLWLLSKSTCFTFRWQCSYSYRTICMNTMSRKGAAIAMGYCLDSCSSIPGSDKIFFSTTHCPNWFWNQSSLISNGHWWLCLKVKEPRREAAHSSPSSAEVKEWWSYTSISPHVFIMWCLIN